MDEWRRQRAQILSLSAYDRHKQLVNDYMLFFPGATKLILQVISASQNTINGMYFITITLKFP